MQEKNRLVEEKMEQSINRATESNPQDDGDELLLERIRQGDQQAFQELFHRYGRYTAAVSMKVGACLIPEDVEEICSDVFVKLWENRKIIEVQEDSLKFWLGTVARNLTLNLLRARSRRAEQTWQYDGCKTCPSAEEDCLEEEEYRALFQVIDQLGDEDKELFLSRYYYGQRVTELAQEKGINVKTISGRLIRIRRRLQSAVSERGLMK